MIARPQQSLEAVAVKVRQAGFSPLILGDLEGEARDVAKVHAGSVYWNCCDRVSPRLPWSGHGDSGVGLTLSTYGIQTFTRPKAWHLKSAG